MASFTVRKGMPGVELRKDEFKNRYRQRFFDPAFSAVPQDIDRIAEIAWQACSEGRKAPVTRRAGGGYADPDYELSVDWIAASNKITEAERRQKEPSSRPRILLIN